MRYLIVRIGALGDVIHSLPMLNTLRRHDPGAEIVWAAGPGAARILLGHPALNRIIVVEKGTGGLLAARKEIKAGKFDLSIDPQGLIKSAFLASAAERRIGRSFGRLRERPAGIFYTDRVEIRHGHVIEENLDLLSPLGMGFTPPARYDLALPPPPGGVIVEKGMIGLNVGASWPTKMWPVERWIGLGRRIEKELGRRCVILWGPGEEEAARRVFSEVEGSVLPPLVSFMEMGRIMLDLDLVVSGETGPLHLAVAVGTKTVALLGPTSPSRNGPFGPGHISVTARVPCTPCYLRRCPNFICMGSIAVDEVFSAVREGLVSLGHI